MRAALLACISLSVWLPAQQPQPTTVESRLLAGADPAANTASQVAWREFQRDNPGPWKAEWCSATGTPRAIYGTGLPLADWRGNSLEEARRHANALLAERGSLLGLGTSEFRESIGQRIGRNWSFVFDQYFRGLPVIGGRADVRVAMVGRIAMFGSKAWPIPTDFVVTPSIAKEAAVATAWMTHGGAPPANPQPGTVQAPRLVIWGDVHAQVAVAPRLAWEITVSAILADGSGPVGRYYVDAQTGAVLRYENDKHECGITGCTGGNRHDEPSTLRAVAEAAPRTPAAPPLPTTLFVSGHVRGGFSGTSPLAFVPLPHLQLQIAGQTVYTDANGRADFDLAVPTTISVLLDGRRCALVQGSSAPTDQINLIPGAVHWTAVLTPTATDDEVAHTTVYRALTQVNEFCRTVLGNSSQLAVLDDIQPNVNIALTCNAYYANNSVNFYRAGGGCVNTAYSTVIAHEWGHGLDAEYGGIAYWNGLSEGWADVVAMYHYDHPLIGEGFLGSGFLRDGNNTHQFPQGQNLHEQGQSFMGFAWKLREHLASLWANRPQAIAVTNDIVLATIAADADSQPEAVLEVFLADDDDGNLTNGTPNYWAIQWAAAQHSLPHPAILPSNDDCVGAATVTEGQNGPFDNTFAAPVMPPLNPPVLSPDTADLWFVYTTGVSGNLTVSTCGLTAMDSTLQIYAGSCGGLASLGSSDNACGLQSQLTVAVTPGSYYIRVGTKVVYTSYGWFYTPGSFQLAITGPTGGAAAHGYYGAGCTGSYGGAYPYIYGADPRFGALVPITTDPYFSGSPIGILALGQLPFVPGLPLDALGAPGCQLLVDFLVTELVLQDLDGRFPYWLSVPHNPTLQGVTVHAQTFVLSPGANALGLTSTDGLGLTIGN